MVDHEIDPHMGLQQGIAGIDRVPSRESIGERETWPLVALQSDYLLRDRLQQTYYRASYELGELIHEGRNTYAEFHRAIRLIQSVLETLRQDVDLLEGWIELPKFSEGYIRGIRSFLRNAFSRYSVGDEITCPYKNYDNHRWHREDVNFDHLIYSGPSPLLVNWICEISNTENVNMEFDEGVYFGDNLGEMLHRTHNCQDKGRGSGKSNEIARNFYRLIKDGKQPLYQGFIKFSRLGFIIRIYTLKCVHEITESAFTDLLELIKEAFPEAHIPLSFKAVKNVIKDLGLDYQKIHASPNNCMLFWGENEKEEVCKACNASRWIVVENKDTSDDILEQLMHKVPAKVMRYFPLKRRLQRLFMCKEYAELMTWNSSRQKKDGKLRHPADAESWKTMDAKFPHFAEDDRNVRLGLASDGFSPYRTMSTTHKSPKNSIDVFMQPLIAELKYLWDKGIETYDALAGENFNLRASILWTISDFSGYAMLSGWSTKGYLGCPNLHRHNLDVMHIEKNLCDSILGTLLNMGGKSKDHLNARFDLQEMGIRKDLHPVLTNDGKEYEIRAAIFDMRNKEKETFYAVLENAKLPYSSASNIRRSRPEASIAEGYLAEECIIFCSRFLNNDGAGKIGKYSAKSEICPQNVEYPIGSRRNKDGKAITLKDSQWMECHRYVLFNCANKEVESLLEEKVHTDDFYKWLQEQVGKKEVVSPELQILSMGPNRVDKKFSGYVINGFRFHTKFRDARCTTQNSGVFLSALTASFASSKDESPLVSEVHYYGRIEEILEIDYWGEISVVLFKCCWYQEETDLYGLIRVNFSKLCQKSDPYILASQVQQVYYLQDPVDKSYHNVIKKLPRDWYEVESPDANESPKTVCAGVEVSDVHWCRDDAPIIEILVTEEEENAS
ncbi:uncharacterized protein LOC141680006 [Apium graveolens]|uniref:uncharacterized protein LOC141680006 n=1 Tax=Apium graveolens TaxID=4045 RepID=UPI003D79B961